MEHSTLMYDVQGSLGCAVLGIPCEGIIAHVLLCTSKLSVQGLGACLTQANLEDIKRFIEDFAVRALLPAMEARVRALNHQVDKLPSNLIACIAAHICDLLPQECRKDENV